MNLLRVYAYKASLRNDGFPAQLLFAIQAKCMPSFALLKTCLVKDISSEFGCRILLDLFYFWSEVSNL